MLDCDQGACSITGMEEGWRQKLECAGEITGRNSTLDGKLKKKILTGIWRSLISKIQVRGPAAESGRPPLSIQAGE